MQRAPDSLPRQQVRRRQVIQSLCALPLVFLPVENTRAFLPLLLRLFFGLGVRRAAVRGALGGLARSGSARAALGGIGASTGWSARAMQVVDSSLLAYDLVSLFSSAEASPISSDGNIEIAVKGTNHTDKKIGGDIVRIVICDEQYLSTDDGGSFFPVDFSGQFSLPPNGSWERNHKIPLGDISSGRHLVIPTCVNPKTNELNDLLFFEPDHYLIDVA